jgi:hypothetical protein
MTLILPLIFAAPVLAAPLSAQAAVQKPSACPLQVEINGKPPAPTANALPPGCETSTLPWSAPIGHHQPQAADLTASATSSIDQTVAEENARVDEAIKGVCRRC